MPHVRDKEPRQKQRSMTKPSNACYSTFLTQTQVVQAGVHMTLRSSNPDGPPSKAANTWIHLETPPSPATESSILNLKDQSAAAPHPIQSLSHSYHHAAR
ncbi:hypothetical protein ABG768_012332 [Culter alburnus]|uniref:Uncharacterized protein n=1 Tax=Culter alburnus TaxID=194366 RepID=A0AAW1ZB75_CULAL